MQIHRPLSPGAGWIESSLFRAYADLALKHLAAKHYFEAIVVSCVGYDVLVNTLLVRIALHHHKKLTPEQQKVIGDIQTRGTLTAGTILGELRKANILHCSLDRALSQFNQERNRVIHPIERQKRLDPSGNASYFLSLKEGAIVPHKATKRDAKRYYGNFCRIIDLSGGESPRKQEKARRAYPSFSQQLRQLRQKIGLAKSPGRDDKGLTPRFSRSRARIARPPTGERDH